MHAEHAWAAAGISENRIAAIGKRYENFMGLLSQIHAQVNDGPEQYHKVPENLCCGKNLRLQVSAAQSKVNPNQKTDRSHGMQRVRADNQVKKRSRRAGRKRKPLAQ
jgi:hypothetical protein